MSFADDLNSVVKTPQQVASEEKTSNSKEAKDMPKQIMIR